MKASPDASQVAAAAARLGRALTDEQAGLLAAYLGLLVKWNSRMNLVGPSAWPEILETLVQDSWHLADLLESLDPQPAETLDLGAGAGLPGIPLRVFWTSGDYWLVEPRQKRALFMEQAAAHMRLPRTRVVCARMEALPPARRRAVEEAVGRGARLPRSGRQGAGHEQRDERRDRRRLRLGVRAGLLGGGQEAVFPPISSCRGRLLKGAA